MLREVGNDFPRLQPQDCPECGQQMSEISSVGTRGHEVGLKGGDVPHEVGGLLASMVGFGKVRTSADVVEGEELRRHLPVNSIGIGLLLNCGQPG